MPRQKRGFYGQTWRDTFLHDATRGFDLVEPDEYEASDGPRRARAFRDEDGASMVLFHPSRVIVVHYLALGPRSWAAYPLELSQRDFIDLVRQFMKATPQPFEPNGRQLASIAYEMLVNYVAVGPRTPSELFPRLPRQVRLFLERSGGATPDRLGS
jgi:hypothetical protein